MNNEKMREEFEAAYKSACLDRPVPRFDPSVFAKNSWGDYLSSLVQSAWWGWQTSRAAIEVELPPIGDYIDRYGQGNNCDEYIDMVKDAIESIGLKVKS